MHKEFLMGNEAIALGALAAGVDLASGYPGTPSTEVLETIAKRNPGSVHVEWSVNEKVGMEVAAGAAYAGARSLVTMKQVGLNVASDPLMSLEYIGVKGGMVVLVADDPGPISSQTEQDTRTFGMFSKIPVFDPASVSDAYGMIQEAFEFSERYGTPVIFRATTRIDHGYEAVEIKDAEEYKRHEIEGFIKDPSRWVIFPRLSVKNHALIEKRNESLKEVLSDYPRNLIQEPERRGCRKGIASHGANFQYVRDVEESRDARIMRIATPFPFPEKLALSFLKDLDEVLCVEELDPVIERALTYVCGKYALPVKIRGKKTGDIPLSGENTPDIVAAAIRSFLGDEAAPSTGKEDDKDLAGVGKGFLEEELTRPELPVRPPVLCAGCPHRASFYAVKTAMKGEKTIFCGDIGCYTLGNAHPLDMCDTCLCMGAGIGIAQGVYHMEKDTKCFAFVGDSTFFASGITETINAFYDQAELVLVVLDNSTTAMTGHQPHPGTGRTIMGQEVQKVSIEKLLKAIGLTVVETVDPLELDLAVQTVKRVAQQPGVKAIIFRSPCIAVTRIAGSSKVDPEKCTGCKKCIRELGCPALILESAELSGAGYQDREEKVKKVKTDPSACTGCTLCEQICPVGAISGGRKNDTVEEVHGNE